MPDKVLCGLGNPLLDIQASVAPGYLKKYNLESNNQILADESHVPMYAELVDWFPVSYLPGGATMNTIRVAKWMMKGSGRALYSGAIGKDSFAETLKEQVALAGVEAHFYEQVEQPTGTCACLISGNTGHRSLVANIAAANTYPESFLSGNAWETISQSDVFYSAGFFLTPPEGTNCMEKLGKLASENGKLFCMNLSAPFLCQFFKDQMLKVLPHCDFVFGNETEAAAFAENNGIEDKSIENIARCIAALPKSNSNPRTVVITQGAEQTVVVKGNDVKTFPVTKVDSLVDTNGAGDAFVAGFLSQLVNEKSIEDCVEAGHFAAGVIIQHNGCTFPETCHFKN